MAGFDITPVELRVCGSMLAQVSEDLRIDLSVLTREMDSLLLGGWQGAAAEDFAQGWEHWLAGAKDALDALSTMGRLLDDTGRDYQSADTSAADKVTRLGEGL